MKRKDTCTGTVGHEVLVFAVVASRVERPVYAHPQIENRKKIATRQQSCTRILIQEVVGVAWLRGVERLKQLCVALLRRL